MMTLDSTILIGAITTLAGCVAYLWRDMRASQTQYAEDFQKRIADKTDELNQCLLRERTLMAKLADIENGGNDA